MTHPVATNRAYIGGVLVQTGTSHSEFVGCTVDKHSAQLYGGFALLSEFSTSSVTSSIIAECRAGDSGGVLYTPPGDAAKLTLADSTIRDNSATYVACLPVLSSPPLWVGGLLDASGET